LAPLIMGSSFSAVRGSIGADDHRRGSLENRGGGSRQR